jgi:Fe-S-cluster-containing hydrogenase component 2
MYVIDKEECTGCGTCLDYCDRGAIRLQDGTAQINQVLCTSCGLCMEACSQKAIYAYEELPVLRAEPRIPVPASKSGITVAQRVPPITRTEKIAAASTLLPVLSRFFLKVVGRIQLPGEYGRRVSGGDVERRQSVGKGGGGRHRWRGGS